MRWRPERGVGCSAVCVGERRDGYIMVIYREYLDGECVIFFPFFV
jgi:hypothetical protein